MYDFVIIGSGFGGSVSALRLSEKGYKVKVIEQGKWFKPEDFPKTNWNIRKWLWFPALNFFGIQKISFLRHITVLSGTGVGGGSLVYANTLPRPKSTFFNKGSWAKLDDWENKLEIYYQKALKMLGASQNTFLGDADQSFKQLAKEMGIEDKFNTTQVTIYFGDEGVEMEDPYFNGRGPKRSGCNFCGACMTGCRYNAKNTLDKNYLHLAQQNGAEILAENKVVDVIDLGNGGDQGYEIIYRSVFSRFARKKRIKTRGVVFSAGVLGTVSLLSKLKKRRLPALSDRLGDMVRTNNEAIIGNVSFDKEKDFSTGIAIGSILELDENSHVEPVRYGQGSGFWRILMMPMVSHKNFFRRVLTLLTAPVTGFREMLRIFAIKDFARQSVMILFMQHLDGAIRLKRNFWGLSSQRTDHVPPTAFIPEAHKLVRHFAKIIKGVNRVLASETLTGIPTTAHILGGAVMGANPSEGVIDRNNKVFNYENIYVCDGSMISANPGVNPSLSITAISEHAMDQIQLKSAQQ